MLKIYFSVSVVALTIILFVALVTLTKGILSKKINTVLK